MYRIQMLKLQNANKRHVEKDQTIGETHWIHGLEDSTYWRCHLPQTDV